MTNHNVNVNLNIVSDADRPTLRKRSYSSPLSSVGATSRIIGTASKVEPGWLSATLLVASIVILLPVVYGLLIGWYTLIFGVFGIFVIPWRLHRRSQRRAQHVAEAQLAAIQRIAR